MTYSLERAIAFAALAHEGQRDKADAPYILHPLRMMLTLTDPLQRMAAVLHDVIEDCGVTAEHLLAEGVPAQVVAAVQALTRHGDHESYADFIARAARHPVARAVKLADLRDNMDLTRIPHPGPRDFERLEKYRAAVRLIESLA
jgi:(p)ppGpp synthase/HD superfamily hydrolase